MTAIPLTPDQAAFLGVDQPKASHESFDGAQTSRVRTVLPRPNLEPVRQIPSYTRKRLVDNFHVIRNNNTGLLRQLIRRTVIGAVGNGIAPKAVTQDEAWNARHDEWFHRIAMSENLDFEGRRSFYEMQAAVVRDLTGPGEHFTNFVDVPGEDLPKLQLIPPQLIQDSGKNDTVDGLLLDKKSSAVRKYCYSVEWGKRQMLDAENVLHVYDMERSGQYRGLPWIYHGINSFIDIGDLTALEKQAAKIHSALAAVVKNSSGTVGTTGITGRVAKATETTTLEDGTTEEKQRALEKMLGGAVPFLGKDESLDLLTSNRPSAVFTGFLDWLECDICIGYGLTREFIKAIGDLGGANTRFVVDEAQRFFDMVGTIIIDKWSAKVRTRLVAAAMQSGALPMCSDPEWPLKVHWQRPAKGTVDRGRDAAANISLLEKGLLSHADYHGWSGEDGAQKDKERILEVAKQKKLVDEIAKTEGVQLTWEEIFDRGGGSKPADANAPDAPAPTKKEPKK